MSDRLKDDIDLIVESLVGTPGSNVASLQLFPRSIAGKYQGDTLARSILCIKGNRPIDKLSAIEVIDRIKAEYDSLGATCYCLSASWLRASTFFQAVTERLRYLETYRPTAGDFAVEELQNAFVGLMSTRYAWGKTGIPTKGEVTQMAKTFLERHDKQKKSGWTQLLRTADLGWLPEGRAGRPPEAEVDETAKAQREYKALCTQAITDFYGGDIIQARDNLKAAYGSKTEYQRSERDRLDSPPTAG